MEMRFQSAILSICLCVNTASLYGGIPTYKGSEPCFWANQSLIVATVVDSGRNPKARNFQELPNYVTLAPKMTLAGSFDCASVKEMKILIVLGAFGSPLDTPPPIGSLVVVHIELYDHGYFVPGFSPQYMPEGLPVWEIWGFHDEALFKIVSTVGERRREGAKKEREERVDCAAWLKSTHPKAVEHVEPPVDKSFESRSIVFGRVKSVQDVNGTDERRVTLRLIGTVAGPLDAALVGEITISIPAKLSESRDLPWRDAEMFVAVDQRDGKVLLAEEGLDYMPSGWAFYPIKASPEESCGLILSNLRAKFAPKPDKDSTRD